MEKLKKILYKIFLCVLRVIIIIGITYLVIDADRPGITKHAQIILGDSEKYSEEEIQAAIDIVLIEFKDFPAVLNKLWYDEEKSKIESKSWIEKYSADDVIVLYSEFRTFKGEQAMLAGFDRDKEYKNWNWVLIRSNNEDWQLETWGY